MLQLIAKSTEKYTRSYVSFLKVKFNDLTPFDKIRLNIPSRNLVSPQEKKIWAVGGGKGGIGKTILTTNMAVYLSWLNKKVIVIDLDLGGANIHTSLGVEPSKKSLSDFVTGKTENIADLLQETKIRNLKIITGAQDPLGIANYHKIEKEKFLKEINKLEADYVLLDLGAGTSSNTIDFFLMAQNKIIVVTPEPTSIENAYRFIKAAYFKNLWNLSSHGDLKQVIESMIEQKTQSGMKSPKDLMNEMIKLAGANAVEMTELLKQFQISLIINQVRVKSEGDIGKSIQLVCEKYFGIAVNPVGAIPYDNSVWQSIRKRVPFLIDAPNSQAVTQLEDVIRNILRLKG